MNKVRLTLLLVVVILVGCVNASNTIPNTAPLCKKCLNYGATTLTIESDVDITHHLLSNVQFSERVKVFSWIDSFYVNSFSVNSGRVEK